MKTIVILGSSYAGVNTAHRLLKQAPKTGDVKIILVGPNTHLYWNMAAPRAIIPGGFSDDTLFGEIAPGFKQYTAAQFEFLNGTAERLDLAAKSVFVATASGEKAVKYDTLILATGSRTKGDIPFKSVSSYEATRDSLHDWQEKVKRASTIVVCGAGATGVETAGELGAEYGTLKKITLISSGAAILDGSPASVVKVATNKLTEYKVDIKVNTKISGSATRPDGKTELTLSDGQKIVTDVYIPTIGLVPNSSYIPQSLLNANGFVLVDEYLRVKGTTDVWAAGDVSSVLRPQFLNTEKQSVHVAKNIGLEMKGKELVKFTATDEKPILMMPLGKKSGTGHMGTMKFPSFMVVMFKSKTYFTSHLGKTIAGSMV